MIYYIYVLRNKINGKLYVGQTNNLAKRRREHKARDRFYTKGSPLYAAIRKYGFDQFEMIPIEEWDNSQDVDIAEMFWIEFFQTRNKQFGYNLTPGGRVNRAFVHSEEWKKEKSRQMTEHFKHNSPWNKGQVMSAEIVERQRQTARRGVASPLAKFSRETIQEIRGKFMELKYSIHELSKIYKSSYNVISNILHNVSYYDPRYMPGEEFWKAYKKLSINKMTAHLK